MFRLNTFFLLQEYIFFIGIFSIMTSILPIDDDIVGLMDFDTDKRKEDVVLNGIIAKMRSSTGELLSIITTQEDQKYKSTVKIGEESIVLSQENTSHETAKYDKEYPIHLFGSLSASLTGRQDTTIMAKVLQIIMVFQSSGKEGNAFIELVFDQDHPDYSIDGTTNIHEKYSETRMKRNEITFGPTYSIIVVHQRRRNQ